MAKIFHDPDGWVHYCMQDDLDNDVDPATVEIKPVNHAEMERYTRLIAKDSTSKNVVGQTTVMQNMSRKQFTEHIRNPSNFFRNGPNGQPIELKSSADLYDYSDNETIAELIRAMESNSKLSEGQKKTSDSLSDTGGQT